MSANTFVIENEDMSDLCRVCLLLPEESQYLDLTTIYDEEDNLTYAECFTICTQIDLSAGVGVPHHLCKPCGLELQMSYDFHKKVEDSKRVIEQCQRQIKVEKENTCELPAAIKYSKKYVNEEQISAVHGITEKYIITDVEEHLPALSDGPEEDCVVEGENEQGFVAPSYVNEETDEIEVMNIECHSETNLLNQVQSQPHNSSLIEVMNENDEDNIEMDDYQNMETLEEDNGKESENNSPCHCTLGLLKHFEDKFSDMNAKFSQMTSEIKELKDIIQTQNEVIMSALSTQKAVTESLVRQEKNNVAVKNVFPINTLDELKALNEVITDENNKSYTNAMRLSLKGNLQKTLTTVLSMELILNINIDGTHGKNRLKDYKKFFDALMDAVRPLCDDPDKVLRKALSVIKKRHFHNVCVEKKTK